MEQTAKSTRVERGATASATRSLPVFLMTSVTTTVGLGLRWGVVGIVLSFLIAFGVTEGLARRFPAGVRLRWVFRPNLLAAIAVALLFLFSLSLRPIGFTCIEGGRGVGSPFPFYVQCYSPGGIPDEPQFNTVGLALDLVVWYVLGALAAALVRPWKPFFFVLA
jgi:predicted cobalt transporter CbtA